MNPESKKQVRERRVCVQVRDLLPAGSGSPGSGESSWSPSGGPHRGDWCWSLPFTCITYDYVRFRTIKLAEEAKNTREENETKLLSLNHSDHCEGGIWVLYATYTPCFIQKTPIEERLVASCSLISSHLISPHPSTGCWPVRVCSDKHVDRVILTVAENRQLKHTNMVFV